MKTVRNLPGVCAAVLTAHILGSTVAQAATVDLQVVQSLGGSYSNVATNVERIIPLVATENSVSRTDVQTFTDRSLNERRFARFDSSLGMLTGITIKFTAGFTGFNGVSGVGTSCETGLISVPCNESLRGDVTLGYGLELDPLDRSLTPPPPPPLFGVIPVDSLFRDPSGVEIGFERDALVRSIGNSTALTGGSRTFSVDQQDWSGFIGSGTFGIRPVVDVYQRTKATCSADNSSTINIPNPLNPFGPPKVITTPNTAVISRCTATTRAHYAFNYSASVTYDYSVQVAPPPPPTVAAVPLPAGLPLLLGALGLLGLARWRQAN